MKSGFLIVGFCLVLLAASVGQAQDFFDSLSDVPVMTGQTEEPSMALSFDKPAGRIAQAGMRLSGVTSEAVLAFYAETLPHMGWVGTGGGAYHRGAEILEISFEKQEGTTYARLTVSPR